MEAEGFGTSRNYCFVTFASCRDLELCVQSVQKKKYKDISPTAEPAPVYTYPHCSQGPTIQEVPNLDADRLQTDYESERYRNRVLERQLQDLCIQLRRYGHISENAPGNVATALQGPLRQARPGAYVSQESQQAFQDAFQRSAHQPQLASFLSQSQAGRTN